MLSVRIKSLEHGGTWIIWIVFWGTSPSTSSTSQPNFASAAGMPSGQAQSHGSAISLMCCSNGSFTKRLMKGGSCVFPSLQASPVVSLQICQSTRPKHAKTVEKLELKWVQSLVRSYFEYTIGYYQNWFEALQDDGHGICPGPACIDHHLSAALSADSNNFGIFAGLLINRFPSPPKNGDDTLPGAQTAFDMVLKQAGPGSFQGACILVTADLRLDLSSILHPLSMLC